jgi:hypothetical protein
MSGISMRPCEICGALIDDEDTTNQHQEWHRKYADALERIADMFDVLTLEIANLKSAGKRGKKHG